MCEISSKSTIKIPERRHWRRSGIYVANFEQISHIVLVFWLLTLSKQMPAKDGGLTKLEKKEMLTFLSITL